MAKGRQVYTSACISCHGAKGEGRPPAYPPLAQTDWVQGDSVRLIKVLTEGLSEPIEVLGETYTQPMPSYAGLGPKRIAAVLTYIRGSWGHDAGPIDVASVEAIMNQP